MSTAGESKTVLVVEDNRVEREGTAVVLREKGYRVLLAANGAEAWKHLRGDPLPDLMLLDMMLPDVDGWQLLAQVRGDPTFASMPVIIATGLGIANPNWAASLGAAGLLRKPFDADRLIQEVERFR